MTWRERARALKREVAALALAVRDPRTPWTARLVASLVVAYAFSPIDLIPGFIPVLGLLDDLLLLPLGAALAIRLVPPVVLAEARERVAAGAGAGRPPNYRAAAGIVLLWLALLVLGVRWLAGLLAG